MDHSSFIYQIKGLPEGQGKDKYNILRRAWLTISRYREDLTFEKFCASIPTEVLNTKFGRDAEDIYFTNLIAMAGYFKPDIDAILASLLNRIVLELNFQTRFLNSGGKAEAFVLDGNESLFPIAMANGNAVAGIRISDDSQVLPEWVSEIAGADYQRHLLYSTPFNQLPDVLKESDRHRIGCLAISLVEDGPSEIDFEQRYAAISTNLREDTYHVISAPRWLGLHVLKLLSEVHPEARVVSKAYACGYGQSSVEKLVLIVTGVLGCLRLKVRNERRESFRIDTLAAIEARAHPTFSRLNYFHGKDGKHVERVELKGPLALATSSPLPLECRNRITGGDGIGASHFPHFVYKIPNGKMMSLKGDSFSSHVYIDGERAVLKDLCDFSGIEFTPFYKNSLVGENGERVGSLKIDKRIYVDGPAMPLTFSPDLHTYHSHFLLQCFPRVLIYRKLMPNGKIIVPPNLRKKQLELLNLAGIQDSDLVFLQDGTLVEADELVVPHPWPLFFSPFTLSIYQEIAEKFPDAPPVTKRALISREQRTTWRNMLTYDMVKDMLVEEYGFEVIRPETLTLAEEINLYRNVEIMIGAEGAGLYSSVFSKKGSTFISIGDEDYIMPVLASAAKFCDFDVAYVFGDSMRSDFDVARRKPYGHSDFAVNPQTVKQVVEAVVEARGK